MLSIGGLETTDPFGQLLSISLLTPLLGLQLLWFAVILRGMFTPLEPGGVIHPSKALLHRRRQNVIYIRTTFCLLEATSNYMWQHIRLPFIWLYMLLFVGTLLLLLRCLVQDWALLSGEDPFQTEGGLHQLKGLQGWCRRYRLRQHQESESALLLLHPIAHKYNSWLGSSTVTSLLSSPEAEPCQARCYHCILGVFGAHRPEWSILVGQSSKYLKYVNKYYI